MNKPYYKIAFCGTGSIGRRHIKNTVLYLQQHNCGYKIDAVRHDTRSEIDAEISGFISGVYSYEDELENDYDIIFITNPTAQHYPAVKKYSRHTAAMFIEKPVFDRADYDIPGLDLKNDGVYYVACPLRYTNVIKYISENINCGEAYCIRAICSSYLPDWRPRVDYRGTYSARKDMGGGVSVDLIHEWDYLIYLFGCPEKLIYTGGRYSNLEIDSDDLAVYIGQSENKIIELHLDYFGRKNIREFEIFLPGDTVKADLAGGRVIYMKSGRAIDLSEQRNDYQMREIAHFFDIINGICPNSNDINKAVLTLKIAKGEL
jgi:predicted dehydrogenase